MAHVPFLAVPVLALTGDSLIQYRRGYSRPAKQRRAMGVLTAMCAKAMAMI
jgi:hypothetical protein